LTIGDDPENVLRISADFQISYAEVHHGREKGRREQRCHVSTDESSGYARSNVVTASIDRLDFHHPVFVGDLLTLRANLNFIGRTSMEVGVRVETENPMTGVRRHTASAYLTYVALDRDGRPMPLPPLILETEEEMRRNREAKARRETRLAEKKKEKACQLRAENC
jgi:acyl-CoA hydrolase